MRKYYDGVGPLGTGGQPPQRDSTLVDISAIPEMAAPPAGGMDGVLSAGAGVSSAALKTALEAVGCKAGASEEEDAACPDGHCVEEEDAACADGHILRYTSNSQFLSRSFLWCLLLSRVHFKGTVLNSLVLFCLAAV